jgi:hypothetical protein
MKKTDLFDKLDNVLGNYAEGKASKNAVIDAVLKVNKYLLDHPHPHDLHRKEPEWELNKFIKIEGKTFSCQECGSNMFSKNLSATKQFKCQGCGAMYQGE